LWINVRQLKEAIMLDVVDINELGKAIEDLKQRFANRKERLAETMAGDPTFADELRRMAERLAEIAHAERKQPPKAAQAPQPGGRPTQTRPEMTHLQPPARR
jgi:hypothetical protein